jgi:hypothetical protein
MGPVSTFVYIWNAENTGCVAETDTCQMFGFNTDLKAFLF